MDATRYCYKAPCRFTVGGPLVDIHWYWADEEASRFLLPHAFPAMTGYRQFKFNDDNIGEMWEAWPRHASVNGPAGVEGTDVDGTPAQFLGRAVYGPVAMGDLPACLLPLVFEQEIELSLATPPPVEHLLEFDCTGDVDAETGTIVFGEETSLATLMEQTILIGAEDSVSLQAIELGVKDTSEPETAVIGMVDESGNGDPPVVPTNLQTATIDLGEETEPANSPAGKESVTIVFDGETADAADSPVVVIEVEDNPTPKTPQEAVVVFDGEDFTLGSGSGSFGSGSGSGSGSSGSGSDGGGPGGECSSAMMMENGVDYTFDVPFDGPYQWFKFFLPAGWTADIAYKTNSGVDRNVVWYWGMCTDLTFIRFTHQALITFPNGPHDLDNYIIGEVVNPGLGAGNYTVRITAS